MDGESGPFERWKRLRRIRRHHKNRIPNTRNTKTVAGICPREALSRALAAALGMPDGRTYTASVKFEHVDNPTDRRLLSLAVQSIALRPHTIVSLWRGCVTDRPRSLAVIHRHVLGVEFVPVDVLRPRTDRAMVLVCGDRRRLFTLTESGALWETSCSPCAAIDQAIARGQAELAEAVGDLRSADAS